MCVKLTNVLWFIPVLSMLFAALVFSLDRDAHFASVRELMRRCQDRIQKEWPGSDCRIGPQDLESHAKKTALLSYKKDHVASA